MKMRKRKWDKRKYKPIRVPLLPPGPAGRLVPLTEKDFYHPYTPPVDAGYWTKQELLLLGVGWNDTVGKPGWVGRLMGTLVTEEQLRQFKHCREANHARRSGRGIQESKAKCCSCGHVFPVSTSQDHCPLCDGWAELAGVS